MLNVMEGPESFAVATSFCEPLRVVVADDHPLLRSGIKTALLHLDNLTVVAEASNGDEALQMVLAHRPDLLILDVSMPGLAPDQVILRARLDFPQLKTLILTAHDDDVFVRKLSQVPISGYLLKDEAPENLTQAVRVIQQGAVWFSQSVANKIMGFSNPQSDPLAQFSAREIEVIRRLGAGMENQAIAEEMHLAKQTVRNYIRIIYQKMNVNSRVQAVVMARHLGLVDESQPTSR